MSVMWTVLPIVAYPGMHQSILTVEICSKCQSERDKPAYEQDDTTIMMILGLNPLCLRCKS